MDQQFPGTGYAKAFLLGCVTCHTQERVAKSTHDAAEWMQTYTRMSGYAPESQPSRPQPAVTVTVTTAWKPPAVATTTGNRKQADWMGPST